MNRKKTETNFFDFNIRYDKEKDKNNTINTDSVLEKREKQLQQFYTGLYFQKCYHNTGRYKWLNGDQEYVYEGKLYANDLHGYGRLIYPDNSMYEGLFLHNKRFGPGVVTYPDAQQDVGLWDGKYLIRLSQNIDLADFYLESIPTLAKTVEGKLFLLKFKDIVPLVDENDPVANLIKKFRLKPEDSEKLYSKCIRNKKSIFMNHSVFNKNFYTDPKELIVDVVDHFDENEEPVITKLTAANLLAWSNEKIHIEIMKHAFMNRKYEKIISYHIRNAFLPNKRDTFMAEGPIEEMSLKLLAACRNDDTVNISKLISDYDLFPDVCDCFGNSTIMYAALANKRNAIKTLVNLGANVNVVNDECVSALMLCILHYIAIKNEILENNWEKAFLKLTSESSITIDGRMWPTGSSSSSSDSEVVKEESTSTKSSMSTSNKSKKRRKSKKGKLLKDKLKNYVFNLIYKAPPKETLSRRVLNLRRKLRLSKIYRRTMKIDKSEAMATIMKTIQTLLKCGADVNACEVPYPPLISALFSDNVEMVELILESDVDVNKKTRRESGSLNPLHIVCAMDKSPNQKVIMDMLLSHGADVNARSNISHWKEARDKLLAGEPMVYANEEIGKTPFHVLAMRYDFEEDTENRIVQIAQMLVESGADANAQYLGHNALSLATLRGNITLMQHILSNFLCDPNGSLGYNMGVPLTMLTLRKYSKSLMPISKIETMMEVLASYNANPFNEIPEFGGNALEFAIASNKQTFFGSKDNLGLRCLHKLSASILRRYIDSRALQVIFNTHIRQQKMNPNIGLIAKYLNFDKAHRILQILLDNFRIPPNYELCMKLLNYIYARFGKGKLPVSFIEKPGTRINSVESGRNKKTDKPSSFEMTKTLVQIKIKNKIYELDFNREDKDNVGTPYKENMPELDKDHEKYKVCYNCLEKVNKNLQLCPYCNLIYFCSEICNLMKNESGEHPCKKLFYVTSAENMLKSREEKRRRTKRLTFRGSCLYPDALRDGDEVIDNDIDDDTDDDSFYMDESDSDDSESRSKRRRKGKRKHGRNRRGRRRRRRHGSRGSRRFRSRHRWYMPTPAPSHYFSSRIGKKVCTATCKGKLIAIGFREPFAVVERRMRRKYQPPEMKHLRRAVWSNRFQCKFPLNEENIDLMLRVARRVNLQLVPITDADDLLNPCDPFDYKFWQLFLPYCVFQNGELFYRSNDCDLLYKLPYNI